MRKLLIKRMEELKTNNGFYFSTRTYFGEKISEIDIYKQDYEKLIGLFEEMVRLNYTPR